jgi:POT family proton-dependent oligopeptide transporter
MFWALYFQQNTYWVTQAQDMNTAIVWHTPDLLGSVNDVMVCAMVPLFSAFVYPALERCGVTCSPLRRIGVGIAAAAGAFVAAALLQLAIVEAGEGALSVAWQLPQYFLISVSETCVAVTGLEFAYTQVTRNTRGAVQAMWTLTQLGQLLTGVVALVHTGTLAEAFFFFAGGMALFGVLFIALAMRYRYATPNQLI